jgi:hypothetical protein
VTPPFVSQLRSNKTPIELVKPGQDTITLRVESGDVWETVRVVASPDQAVSEVKARVVDRLYPGGVQHVDEFILKFRGWEVLNEAESIKSAGLTDGSILLLAYRRRRPVR